MKDATVFYKIKAAEYKEYAQAKVVQEHITKVGPIKTAEDLKKIKGLDDATRAKLAAALRV